MIKSIHVLPLVYVALGRSVCIGARLFVIMNWARDDRCEMTPSFASHMRITSMF
jgi:hypothetical protein